MHYLLTYELASDYLERRGQYRDAHLGLAWAAQQRGEIIIAGALCEPADTAVLLFECDSTAPIEQFVKDDPYVIHRLVTGYRIRQWNTVVGEHAATPLHPAS
jgi:hypothetical protein